MSDRLAQGSQPKFHHKIYDFMPILPPYFMIFYDIFVTFSDGVDHAANKNKSSGEKGQEAWGTVGPQGGHGNMPVIFFVFLGFLHPSKLLF